MTSPSPALSADGRLGDLAHLVGYDLPEATAAPGGTLPLTLYWRATGGADRAYTVFVHLIDAQGNIAGAGDGEPGAGALPTTSWLTGEYLVDRHAIAVDTAAAPGAYRMAVGLYDPASGRRLSTPEGADQILLATTVTLK